MRAAWVRGNLITLRAAGDRAEALVVDKGRITYVGDSRGALAAAGPGAEVRDLGGATAIPGFNDNHLHAVAFGDRALVPSLRGLDARGIVELLRERFPDPAPGAVIRGFDWDYPACPEPRKELLDAAFPRNPVVLSQFSGHGQWMNGAALRAIGIRRGGPDPARGFVLRDPDGDPTGIVRDLGDHPLQRRRYRELYYDRAGRERRLSIALEAFARWGITSVQDNSWYHPELYTLARWARSGRLTARFSCWTRPALAREAAAMDALFALGLGVPDLVERGPAKHFVDGAFSSRSAYLLEPYADGEGPGTAAGRADPSAAPSAPAPLSDLDAALARLASARRQGAFHAIGDRAVSLFLDAYEEALRRRPALGGLRIRIEHAQLVAPRDVERCARLGLLVAAQPVALCDPAKDRRLLGEERALRAYPYRSLLDAGVPLSFGSDVPGESELDPFAGIHHAVNREGPERIGVEEALRCYTAGSAYAQFAEDRKGILAPGMCADFAVLSADPTAAPAARIRDIEVAETVMGGRTVWKAPAAPI